MMIAEYMPLTDTKTLAHRLSQGRLPVAEALRYAMELADSLRKLHDRGRAHGAVTPSNLALVAGGVELLPALEGSARVITPYTAPEVVQGRVADARSDIFGFGAILFELLTGRRAFGGESRATLAANLTKTPIPASGSPALDRLVGPCVTKNPDARSPRMQRVMMELKLLSVAARRAGTGSGGTVHGNTVHGDTAADIQELEARVAARLQAHEKRVSEMHRSAHEAVRSLKLQVAAISWELSASYQNPGEPSQVDPGFAVLNARVGPIERTVEEMRRHISQLEHSVAADLVDIEQGIKMQSAAIESSRTAMSQTDDLVEHVVEALESLQTAVMDQGESERACLAVS